MCGIAGFTHSNRREAAGIIRAALDSIRHRGPNQQGTFEGDSIAMGAVRLKIIDLYGGDQPMRLEREDLTLAFNGEIYNHRALRQELTALGHRFETECDTEVVLHAFAQWDVKCFERLRGMFAAAFWQEKRKRLVLVRDRLGIKPLYFAQHAGQVHFGSELKAIWAHPAIPRRLSRDALPYFLLLNYIPGPYTLAHDIQKLPPGCYLEWTAGKIAQKHYWKLRFSPQPIREEEAIETLDLLMTQSVQEHLVADVPLGIWASGGLDSSAILHYASQAASGRKLKTFSISFQGRSFDESRFFRALSAQYATDHHEFDLHGDLDLASACHDLSYYSDEPSADAGALPVYFLSRMSARHVTVALSGEGADEIFGGYQTYLADRYASRIRLLPRWLLRLGLSAARRLPVSDDKIGLDYKLNRFLEGALLPPDDAHFFWNGTSSSSDLSAFTRPVQASSLIDRLPGAPKDDLVSRYIFADQNYFLPDDILYKCDRMSMASSLEVRPPFLDHRIVEFAAGLPSSLKIRGRSTKHVMRLLLRRKLPALILNRRKEGLDIPAHEWLRGPLRPLVEQTLSSDAVERAGAVPASFVRRVLDQHMSRQANLGYHIWGLLTMHLWIARWNVQPLAELDSAPELAVQTT